MVVGYAAFQSVLNIKGTSNVSSNWNIKITNIETKNIVGGASNKEDPTGVGTLTATFNTNLVSPGDSLEYDITVTNSGSLNAVLEKITVSDSNNPAIKFTTTGLTEGDSLTANGGTATLTVKVEYDNNVTTQPNNLKSELNVTLDYVQADGSSATPGGETAADKLIATATNSGDGLYSDNTEAGRYIYKGANPSNYITFNNETWRIMSVESDNTIKIIRNESIVTKAWDTSKSNNWARPATLNTYLNGAYYSSLSSEAQNLIQTHTWSIGPVTYNNTDLTAQIQSENSTIWNGNIGLMTVSEFLRANTNIEQCGNYSLNNTNSSICTTTNYIVPTKSSLWTISPDAGGSGDVFSARYVGNVAHYGPSNYTYSSVSPVLYLTSDINLDGEGTSSNPYTIVSK